MPIGDQVSKRTSPKHFTRLTSTPSTTAQEPPSATSGVLRVAARGGDARLVRDPRAMAPQDVLSLQRSVGNRAVSQLLQGLPRPQGAHNAAPGSVQLSAQPPTLTENHPAPHGRLIQRKLAVGPANDPFEREADQAAKQVSRALARPALAKTVQRNKQDELQTFSVGSPSAQGNDKTAGKAGESNRQGAPGALRGPKLAHGPAQRRIQRKVFFELDELQKQDVANLEITKVNMAERPAFVKGRWKYLDKSKGKGKNLDYRHIVSFDLIKKALGRVLKSKTVNEAALWLADSKHWIDQGYVNKDILPLEMLKSVQGTQAAAENWLKNANSYENNLWRGPRTENRQKGIYSALSKGGIRETWANNKPLGEFSNVKDIVATDKTSGSNLPFEDDHGLQYVNLNDFFKRFALFRIQGRLEGGGLVFRAMAGSTLQISMKDKSEFKASAIYGVGDSIFRVGRGFQIDDKAAIPDKNDIDKVTRLTQNIPGTRKQFIDSQVDPTPNGVTGTHVGARNSLLMYDAADVLKPVVDIALSGTKYAIQMARLGGDPSPVSATGGTLADPQLESDIQRASNGGAPLDNSVRAPLEQAFGTDFGQVRVHADSTADRLNRSVNAKAFTTGDNIFFRQGYYKPESSGGRELLAHELAHVVQQKGGASGDASSGVRTLQRKVHFDLREKINKNPKPQQPLQDPAFLQWKIKHVEVSGRPPILKSRQGDNRTQKGEDYRHVVSFTLIAKALRKVLKGMTIAEASSWLKDKQNWIDQDYLSDDLLDERFLGSVQGIQAAADNWLKNANSFKGNLWPGPSSENRQKGGEAAGAKKKIGKNWVGPEAVKTTEGFLVSQSSSGEVMPFEDNDGNRTADMLALSSIPDGKIFKAMMGAKFYVIRSKVNPLPVGSAVYITGGAVHMVGRNFQGQKALDSVRDTHLHAQLDHPSGPSSARQAINSLVIRDKNRKRLPVVTVALGQKPGKYLPQSLLSQISDPILTQEERAVQDEAEVQKNKMLDFVGRRIGNKTYDQAAWHELAYPLKAIEEYFVNDVIPKCTSASGVRTFVQQTWNNLNAASTGAKEIANMVREIERNGYDRLDYTVDVNKWRSSVCVMAKKNQLDQIKDIWRQVEETFPRRRSSYQSGPQNSRPGQSYGPPQTSYRSSRDPYPQSSRDDRRDPYPHSSRDDRRDSTLNSNDDQKSLKKRTSEDIGLYKSNQSEGRHLKDFQNRGSHKPSSGMELISSQSMSHFTGQFPSQDLGQDTNPFSVQSTYPTTYPTTYLTSNQFNSQPPNQFTNQFTSQFTTQPTTQSINPSSTPLQLPLFTDPGQLNTLLQSLTNLAQSQTLSTQSQSFSFSMPPQTNQTQSLTSPTQQGFNFFPPQQQSPYIHRFVNIVDGFNVVGSGQVLQDNGQTVLVSVKWKTGQVEARTFAKDSPNLRWL